MMVLKLGMPVSINTLVKLIAKKGLYTFSVAGMKHFSTRQAAVTGAFYFGAVCSPMKYSRFAANESQYL